MHTKRSLLGEARGKAYLRRSNTSQNYQVRKIRTKLDSAVIEPIFTEPVSESPAIHISLRDKENISAEAVRKLSKKSTYTSRKPFQGLRLKSLR
jgi:hypothetical protein